MPSRIMKPTLTTAFAEAVLPLTLDGIVVDDTNYKEGLKSIHTSFTPLFPRVKHHLNTNTC